MDAIAVGPLDTASDLNHANLSDELTGGKRRSASRLRVPGITATTAIVLARDVLTAAEPWPALRE